MATQRKLIPLSELELSTFRNVTTARKRRASDSKWANKILDRDHPLKPSTQAEEKKAEEKKARNANTTAKWLNSKSGQEALQKNYEKNKMENSNMKYDHDKILAESASLTLSDLEQLQSAPGPVTEAVSKHDIQLQRVYKAGIAAGSGKWNHNRKDSGEVQDQLDSIRWKARKLALKDPNIKPKVKDNLMTPSQGVGDVETEKALGKGITKGKGKKIDFSHKRTLGDILSEKRRGKPGTPKGEEHARDTEERTERRQEHENEVASRDGGPYVARDIEVGSYQPPIHGSGGSRQPKKKRGAKLKRLRSKGTK